MPLYRYVCTNCVIEFEKIMTYRMKEALEKRVYGVVCPDCGCENTTPLVSKTSFALKGSGWYKDGYSKDSE